MQTLLPPMPLVWDPALPSVFLAGTIDMGNSIDWQQSIGNIFNELGIIVLNPRRPQWNADWRQSIDNPPFREQVEWELEALERATFILYHFEPTSKSPITLMELGLHARSGKCVVHCPEGFWRKGNVDVVCHRYGAALVPSLEAAVDWIKARLK